MEEEASRVLSADTKNSSFHPVGEQGSTELASRENASDETLAEQTAISPTRSKLILIVLLCLVFVGAAVLSIAAPFFPSRAMEKGVSQTMAGIILGSMQLSQFVAAMIFAIAIFTFGPKLMLCCGTIWAASCSLLFGLLDLGPSDASYPALCLLVRLFHGVGVAAYFVSSSTILGVLYSDNLAFVIGIFNTFSSLGILIGPSIGGAIYSAGGYIMPFAVMGALLLPLALLIAVIVPKTVLSSAVNGHDSPIRVFKAMLTPSMGALFYIMLAAKVTAVFIETTLGVRLRDFAVTDPFHVGCVYMSTSGSFAIIAPIAGIITDSHDAGWLVLFLGTWLMLFGCFIIGPSIFLSSFIDAGLVQLIIGALIIQCGMGGCVVSMTRELQREAAFNGLDTNHATTMAFVSAFFNSCWGLGGFLGAIIGGALVENLGFETATSILSVVLLPSVVLQLLLFAKFGHCKAVCNHEIYAYATI